MKALHQPQKREDPGSQRPVLRWPLATPIVALLMVQIGLYLWMVPRGFEFTDESYYLLNYLHWREVVATNSFFGAYFEWPFRALGQSLPAMRVLSLLMLLGSSAFLSWHSLAAFAPNRRPSLAQQGPVMLVCMAGSLLYFGYLSTLRAPSYNLLALCAMMVSTGFLLQLLCTDLSTAARRANAIGYGLLLGACGLGKASSGVLLVLCHGLFFALANRHWQASRLLALLGWTVFGVVINVALLQALHPSWIAALREGVAMASTTDESYGLLRLLNNLRWDVQRLLPGLLPWLSAAVLIHLVLTRWAAGRRPWVLACWVVILVAACVAVLLDQSSTRRWLPVLGATVLLLWSTEFWVRKDWTLSRDDGFRLFLLLLLLVLPLAFSLGTNMAVLEHSQKAAGFVVVALCLCLYRLNRLELLPRQALASAFFLLCLPALVTQVRAATDVNFTYRQLSALGQQNRRVEFGPLKNPLLVDERNAETLQALMKAASAAGLVPGQRVMDFTGDGPGLVYTLGARPLGVAWLIGGYPGSRATAARLLSNVPAAELSGAWLLSSPDNPRAIADWDELIKDRLGELTHERVVTIRYRAPYRWDPTWPEMIAVDLWRPRLATVSP